MVALNCTVLIVSYNFQGIKLIQEGSCMENKDSAHLVDLQFQLIGSITKSLPAGMHTSQHTVYEGLNFQDFQEVFRGVKCSSSFVEIHLKISNF